jgi:hypothetical protein
MTAEIVALEHKYPHKKPFKESISLEQLRREALTDPELVAAAKRARKILGPETGGGGHR